MVHEISSGIIIFRRMREVQFLFLMKKDGYLDFSKGHIEKGENKYTAALRETKEECGITCKIIKGFEVATDYYFYFDSKNIHKEVILFLSEVSSSTKVITSEEHQAYVWLNFEDAMLYLKHENQKEIIRKALKYIEEKLYPQTQTAAS